MANETVVDAGPTQTSPAHTCGMEAGEVRDWRVSKVRRVPRRVRIWTLRIFAFCVGTLLLLGVLGQVLTFTSYTVTHASHSDGPRQK